MDTARPLHAEPIDRECRICLTVGSKQLVAPCLCKGSAKYIHISCLNEFIFHKYKSTRKDGQILPQTPICQICKSSYKNLQLIFQKRLLNCSQIFQNQKQRAFIFLFIISNILIFAALFAGIAIFFVKQKMSWLLGVIWYVSLVVFILVLWGCTYKNFKKAIYKYQYHFRKIQRSPLSINLNPTERNREKRSQIRSKSNRQCKK